jgi:hypothetical protein
LTSFIINIQPPPIDPADDLPATPSSSLARGCEFGRIYAGPSYYNCNQSDIFERLLRIGSLKREIGEYFEQHRWCNKSTNAKNDEVSRSYFRKPSF